jgi:hypothetical protein
VSPAVISQTVLDESRLFFEERGSVGCEGTAMIAKSTTMGTTRLVIPEQRAGAAPHCWVEVTEAGKLQLAVTRRPDERYVSRIHSHPIEAFHSPTDNMNPAITHEGALSIVVPYFGLGLRRGLGACAVLVRRGGCWIDVPAGAARELVVVAR